MSHDLIIRGGTVVDGSGMPRYRADVGVDAGRITAIGRINERADREIDAEGHVVTPGFIDGHTHMDAQVMWDSLGSCSSYHGITTAVMGNCGFTLAPVNPDARELVVRNLERAEDIAAEAMAVGIDWTWSSFAEYLDAVEQRSFAINYAANIGHSALRTWAMGEAAFERVATEDEQRLMEGQLREALDAGAMGFTTSRSASHETSDNRPVASRVAGWDEVTRLVSVLGQYPARPFELALDPSCHVEDPAVRRASLEAMRDLALGTGASIMFGILPTRSQRPLELLGLIEETTRAGGRMFGQSACRGTTVLMSFETRMPFDQLPEWRELRALDVEQQRAMLAKADVRERLVRAAQDGAYGRGIGTELQPPKYDQILVYDHVLPPHRSIAEVAAERSMDPVEVIIDLALESEMKQLFAQIYATDLDPVIEPILRHPYTAMTFSDAGAHVSQICDFSIQTYLLGHWVRNRELLTLEEAVRSMTYVPSALWGFRDRGLVREGFMADLNVIDPERIEPDVPTVVRDLPAGAKRLHQTCTGIKATVVGGEETFASGKHTGALPGRLQRRR